MSYSDPSHDLPSGFNRDLDDTDRRLLLWKPFRYALPGMSVFPHPSRSFFHSYSVTLFVELDHMCPTVSHVPASLSSQLSSIRSLFLAASTYGDCFSPLLGPFEPNPSPMYST